MREHVEAVHAPSRRCRRPARGSRRSGSGALRSKTPMLSRPRKPPWKMLLPSASLRLTHQVKLSSSLWKTRSRKARSPAPRALPVDLVDAPGGPGVHRRVHVAEVPLVGRELAVRVHVPLAQQQQQLRPWRTPGRPAPAGCSGRRGPRRRTRGTPTCPASRGRRRCRGAASRGCARACALAGGGGAPGSPSSQRRRRSGRTASTRAAPRSAWRWTPRASSVRRRRARAA